MSFGGKTFDDERDGDRLRRQLDAVWVVMFDQQWRTLHQLAREVGAPEASVSARLRDFRKKKFGGHTVQRAHIRNGLHQYRILPAKRK